VGFFWLLFLTTFWSVFRSSLLRRHLAGVATIYGHLWPKVAVVDV